MFFSRIVPLLLLCSLPLGAKDQKAYNQISADTVELSGKAYISPAAVKQLLGNDLGGHYIVVQMTVTPKGDKPLAVQLDDFHMFCEGDGDRTQPQTPAEITSTDAMVLKRGESGIGSLGEEVGTTWSGVGFGGGRARKKQDDKLTPVKTEKEKQDDALKALLAEKALPEAETAKPVSGLLYFPMEKKKLKDLVLFYTTPTGKLRLYFK